MLTATVMALYHGVAEPLLALRRRRARLAAFGVAEPALPVVEVHPAGSRCACSSEEQRAGAAREIVSRYVGARTALGRTGLLPMIVDLDRYPTVADFEAQLRKRSPRTLPKVRRALKLGYAAHRFPLRRHVYDVHAVKTSMRIRAAGPVLDYWLLHPDDVGRPATRPTRLRPPLCIEHWSLWWGAFLAAPGHQQGVVTVDERLVAYMKLTRLGDLLHYTDVMGHAEHLDAGVMWLLHVEIMRWLIARDDPLAGGVRVVLYGAAEHGREGLLTWKKRAGFEPALLIAAPGPVHGP